MALLVPLESLAVFSGVLNNGVKFFNFVRRNIVDFHLLVCSVNFGLVNPIAALLSL